jgi:hypothetical protein
VNPSLRGLARRILAVRRTPAYFLPWLCRHGLDCVLILNNVEARFREGHRQGPFPVSAVQYDADGKPVKRYEATLADSADTAEVPLQPTIAGCGFVTVDVSRLQSDHYVTLSDGVAYAATHGRQEFIEHYPIWTRVLMALLAGGLTLLGRTIPAFVRHQYAYAGPGSNSHLLLLNLSNATNRIRVTTYRDGARAAARLVRVPPMGSVLLEADQLAGPVAAGPAVLQLTLEGNAWFNLYLVGAGPGGLTGPLSLMHVK